MAITLADFNKIWASTSPLTPYSFSKSNYKQGWNFIGSTPPARQMWDFLQKNNDEKMQYLANNYLPLTGGTMSGAIVSSITDIIKQTTNTSHTTILGGTAYSSGASLVLRGGDEAVQAGAFQLKAQDGSVYKDFVGFSDGTLTWGGVSLTDGTFLTVRTVNLTAETSTSGLVGSITAPAVSGYQFLCWFAHISGGASFFCYPNVATSQTPNIYAINPVSGKVIVNYALYIRKW